MERVLGRRNMKCLISFINLIHARSHARNSELGYVNNLSRVTNHLKRDTIVVSCYLLQIGEGVGEMDNCLHEAERAPQPASGPVPLDKKK